MQLSTLRTYRPVRPDFLEDQRDELEEERRAYGTYGFAWVLLAMLPRHGQLWVRDVLSNLLPSLVCD